MAVLSTDLIFNKTLGTNGILGGAIDTATVATGGNVWDAFTGDETSAGGTFYACVYARNASAETAFASKVWVNSETSHAGVNVTIAKSASAINASAATIANENTLPAITGSFVDASDEANAISIGDLTAGQYQAFWLRIVIAPATAAVNNYTVQLSFKADTGA